MLEILSVNLTFPTLSDQNSAFPWLFSLRNLSRRQAEARREDTESGFWILPGYVCKNLAVVFCFDRNLCFPVGDFQVGFLSP